MTQVSSTAVVGMMEDGLHAKGAMELDDDGRPRRTGTVWTASAHIVTAVIGSGVLSLAWAMAQLGWLVGPVVLIAFSLITYSTSAFLADCYRTSDQVHGGRNFNYMSAVKSHLGKKQIWMCGLCQYINLCGTTVGYTITAGISAAAVIKSHCYHQKGHEADCSVSHSNYMIMFGVAEMVISQLPDFHNISWLSALAAVMSFSYSLIGIGLGIAQVASGKGGSTSLFGTIVGVDVTRAEKAWRICQALGNIAFAYSYSMVLIEIQDTLRSEPPENKVMKKASLIGVSTTTLFYMLCGCLGYAAFGNEAPGNMLTGFGFYEPFYLIDIANICIVIHLLGAYQVFCQPVFAIVEGTAKKLHPNSLILTNEITLIHLSSTYSVKINTFRLIWRTSFVTISMLLAIALPFFNDILGLLGALAFWPLTVYFPVEMYLSIRKIPRSSYKAVVLQMLSIVCLCVSVAAAIGSIQGVVVSLAAYKPFQTKS